MNFVPGPLQTVAICLGIALPILLLCMARISGVGGAGRRFRIGCAIAGAAFAMACLALPGERNADDVAGGILLLATAMLLLHVIWSLLAWGFTLTLLTALAEAGRPLTLEQWAAVYMQGGDLGTFAQNRLKLLLGAGMVVAADGRIAATATGMAVARLARLVRLATGVGG